MAYHDTEGDAKTPLMTKEDVYRAFVDKLDFWNDMPVLIRVMSEKFANRRQMKKWSGVADQRQRKLRTVLTHVTQMLCCGEFKEFLQDYARHSKFIGPAAEDDGQCPDCTNLLQNLMGVYNHMENKGQQYDNAQFGILQSLQGARH